MTAPSVIRRRSRTALVVLFATMAAVGLAACSSGHKDRTSRHRSATKPPAPKKPAKPAAAPARQGAAQSTTTTPPVVQQ